MTHWITGGEKKVVGLYGPYTGIKAGCGRIDPYIRYLPVWVFQHAPLPCEKPRQIYVHQVIEHGPCDPLGDVFFHFSTEVFVHERLRELVERLGSRFVFQELCQWPHISELSSLCCHILRFRECAKEHT